MIRAPNARSASEGPGRDSFYRFQELYEKGGDLALAEMTRAKPNLKNRVAPHVEEAVVALAVDRPAGAPLAGRIFSGAKSPGRFGGPGAGVGRTEEAGARGVAVRRPFDLAASRDLETMKKRLKALEAKVAQASQPVRQRRRN